ncbi:SSU rRNA (adenine(1518)-N(6)/adenine(1519)-N(6))-dimethyltransferase [hydrothermal vent metagenome]|uniref:SSU rRNA (Adenine(1518)-N(6)/adenine(1519)-N(6))-dimethyltransferase n=1 Tax=hydrothermal vent metagenome TaxID=652676 RepID=A0A3B1DT06_9ZZZZ
MHLSKKRFGQNFLKDEFILLKIIESMPHNNNHIVEIGPGLGDLTRKLVKCKDVTAFEVDRDLYAVLQTEFIQDIRSGSLRLLLGDVLERWDSSTLIKSKYDLIANLPYYISTNIILRALDDDNCENIIVMVQKEVANKFIASARDKHFSSIGVISQLVSKSRRSIINVSPASFSPPPKVDSTVIHIVKNMDNKVSTEFKKFLKLCFSQPRKKLIKNLLNEFDKNLLSHVFDKLKLKYTIRPHEVDASLYSLLYKGINNGREYTASTNKFND